MSKDLRSLDVKPRVAVVHNLGDGGARRRLGEQLKRLEGRFDLIECILQGAKPVTSEPMIIPLRTKAASSPSWRRPAERYGDVARLMRAYRRMTQVIVSLRCDVIWLNPCARIQTPWLGPELARRSFYYCDEPRRIDYDLASRGTTAARTRIPYWPLRRLERYLDRSTATKVSLAATNSTFTAEAVRNAYGLNPIIVPCGIADDFSPDPGCKITHLLSVGTLIPSKGHDLVLQAAAQSGLELPVHVVSHRDVADERERLRRLATRLSVPLVIHIGIADSELRDLYRGAFATLYLSAHEPFGLASLEAQACGSPVIVARDGGLPETLVEGRSGYIVRRGTSDAAERLRQLACDEVLRSRLSSYGVEVSRQWSWRRSADLVADRLLELAK